ncbi:MAG: AIR synthase family protein [Firmicutes bacterium]|nr:AIR synthase family protein [Bacillota bacterium]
MQTGKLPDSVLNKLIIEPITENSVERKEVLLKPSVGEDCAAVNFGDNICIASTDPITGAVKDIGKLAVHINTNDIAAGGGEPVGILVTTLLPTDITYEDIKKITEDIYTEAKKLNIVVLGGHTEVTDAVKKPIISCTVLGKTKKIISSSGAKAGDSVIITKYAALEGSCILAKERDIPLSPSEKEDIENMSEMLSVVKEGSIASKLGVHAMHDITEGGVLGACWEVATCSNTGIYIDADTIPLLPVTKKICDHLGADPLKLISSGSMLMASDKGKELVKELEKNGIKATIIGKFTEDTKKIYKYQNKEYPLEEPGSDELYRV